MSGDRSTGRRFLRTARVDGRVKASGQEICKALTGNWRDEHLFALKVALDTYDALAVRLSDCDAKLEQLLPKRARQDVDIGKAPRLGSKARAEFELRQRLANWAGVDLTRIPWLTTITLAG
jgi:transposase